MCFWNLYWYICITILFPSLKSRVEEALKGNQVPTAKDFRKFSQNYQISKRVSVPGVDPVSAKVEGNVVFDPNSYVPKETMLKTTLNVYGFGPSDIFEVQQLSKPFASVQLFSFSFLFAYNNFLWIMYCFYKLWEKSKGHYAYKGTFIWSQWALEQAIRFVMSFATDWMDDPVGVIKGLSLGWNEPICNKLTSC